MKQMFLWYFLGIIPVVLILGVQSANAASLYIDPPTTILNRGDSVTLSVRLDTDEAIQECVNAVDAVISYPANIDPVDISTGNSIFNVWVESPTINREKREITFAGGIPNGYCGRVSGDPRLTNTLTQIVFRSPGFVIGSDVEDDSLATISFTEQSTAYLNDGMGTKANLSTYPAKINLSNSVGPSLQNQWRQKIQADNIPPEEFSISLDRSDTAFSKKWFISFRTSDKQTGIDHYEVMEEPLAQFAAFKWGGADAPWQETRSPYVLKDQSLNSIVRVRAIDKAGNEYVANIIPDDSKRTMSQTQMFSIVAGFAGLVVLMLTVGVVMWFLRKRKSAEVSEETEEDIYEDESEEEEQVQKKTEGVYDDEYDNND